MGVYGKLQFLWMENAIEIEIDAGWDNAIRSIFDCPLTHIVINKSFSCNYIVWLNGTFHKSIPITVEICSHSYSFSCRLCQWWSTANNISSSGNNNNKNITFLFNVFVCVFHFLSFFYFLFVSSRFCLIVFTLFTVLATFAVLASAPHIIVS